MISTKTLDLLGGKKSVCGSTNSKEVKGKFVDKNPFIQAFVHLATSPAFLHRTWYYSGYRESASHKTHKVLSSCRLPSLWEGKTDINQGNKYMESSRVVGRIESNLSGGGMGL